MDDRQAYRASAGYSCLFQWDIYVGHLKNVPGECPNHKMSQVMSHDNDESEPVRTTLGG